MLALPPSPLNNFIFNINGKFTDFVIGKAIADAKLPFVRDTPDLGQMAKSTPAPPGRGKC